MNYILLGSCAWVLACNNWVCGCYVAYQLQFWGFTMCVLGVFTVRMAIDGHQQIMRSDCVLMRSCTILAESESSAATE